jgi:hypothetical protein
MDDFSFCQSYCEEIIKSPMTNRFDYDIIKTALTSIEGRKSTASESGGNWIWKKIKEN